MFGSFQIARVAGIPVRLHWTMLLFVPYLAPRLSNALGPVDPLWGWTAAIALFLSVLLHELGHAILARGRGYPVRDIVLTPIGGVAFLARAPRKPNDELAIAVAGPAVSLLLAALCWLAAAPLLRAGLAGPGLTLELIGYINLMLLLFNLIPCFPMDGGRVFRALRTRKVGRLQATAQAVRLGKFFAIAFVIIGLFHNIFLIIIAFVVWQAAATEYRLVQAQEAPRTPPPFARWASFSPFGPFQAASREPRPVDAADVEVSPPPYQR